MVSEGIELRGARLIGLNEHHSTWSGFSVLTQEAGQVHVRVCRSAGPGWSLRRCDLELGEGERVRSVRGVFRDIAPILIAPGKKGGALRLVLFDCRMMEIQRQLALPALGTLRPLYQVGPGSGSLWVQLEDRMDSLARLDLDSGQLQRDAMRLSPLGSQMSSQPRVGRWVGHGSACYGVVWEKEGVTEDSIEYGSGRGLRRVYGPTGAPDELVSRSFDVFGFRSLLGIGEGLDRRVFLGVPYDGKRAWEDRWGIVGRWTPGRGWEEISISGVIGLGMGLVHYAGQVWALGVNLEERDRFEDAIFDLIDDPHVDVACHLGTNERIGFSRLRRPFVLADSEAGLFVWGRSGTRLECRLLCPSGERE